MREALQIIYDSLRREPDKWTRTRFQLENAELGASVWVCNGYYGLGVSIDGREIAGGVTGLSTFFGRFIPWRRKIGGAAFAIVKGRGKAETAAFERRFVERASQPRML